MIKALILISLCALASAFPRTVGNNPEEAGYFEGDIRFVDELNPKAGIIGDSYRWPGGIVPIQIDPEFTSSELAIVNSGLADISSKTCLQFVTRTTEPNWVFIDRGTANSGCWSYVGNLRRGMQLLNLQPSVAGSGTCITKGISAHEMIHALGFYHEQSRTDRDNYVTINWSNIQSGTEHNFNKYGPGEVDDQGVSYDYGSIMHYGAYSFAVNPSIQTIIPPSGVSIGQRNGLSDKDAQKLKNMYNC